MSIRNIKKDHLKKSSNFQLVASEVLSLPDHQDSLKFWTHHPTENTLIDLSIFADGQSERPINCGKWSGPFSGRPKLIHQLSAAIQESSVGITKAYAGAYIWAIRSWWRLLDAVEKEADQAGHPMDRVDDVRQITRVHYAFAHRCRMPPDKFRIFLRIANLTLRSLGAPGLYWNAPESSEPKRHLPPEDQISALRIALKQAWGDVRRRWALLDSIRAEGFEPQTKEELNLLKHWRYFADMQSKYGKVLPTNSELRDGRSCRDFCGATGLRLKVMRATVFPDLWEADTAFHLCLANTGWNRATVFSLDVSQAFLRVHPKDEKRYLLTGTKARAGGKEQPVSGLWKTQSGPGFIIKKWMERTAPLREELKVRLVGERARYAQMAANGASPNELTRQLKTIHKLEYGCKSVWLYVGGQGDIEWLAPTDAHKYSANGKSTSYLTVFLDRLNCERALSGKVPIAPVVASDFRDIFALFVWRMSGGNILAVMRALNHAHCSATERYANNNILNAERDHQTRTFLDHLFAELGVGRLDITILAHLQRHGCVTEEMQQRLTYYRTLQRSRMGVACKDPFHPPSDIQPESLKEKICASQRCLLCKAHAVILPESLSGIVMRISELEAIQEVIPVETWLNSRLPEELRNGLDVLKLFGAEEVGKMHAHWSQAIAAGQHHVPGLLSW